MEYEFKTEFLPGDRIRVTETFSGDSVVLQYYEDDQELYLLSFKYERAGVSFSLLESFFAAAGDEITIRKHEELYESVGPVEKKRLPREIEELRQLIGGAPISSDEEGVKLALQKDLKLLSESPKDFFQLLDMEKEFPAAEEEYTGAQFFRSRLNEEKRPGIPAALKAQLDTFYKTEYSSRLGYPMALLTAPREEYAQSQLAFYPDSPGGVLFVDRAHVFGIIGFSGMRGYFATDWNGRRGPRAPQFYRSQSGRMLLVKKFSLDEEGRIADPESPTWYSFFNIFPNVAVREYAEFLRRSVGRA